MGFRPRYRVVTVYWVDSATYDKWQEADAEREPYEIATTGYLVRKTSKQVEIASTVADLGDVCSLITIPLGCVVRIETRRRP